MVVIRRTAGSQVVRAATHLWSCRTLPGVILVRTKLESLLHNICCLVSGHYTCKKLLINICHRLS